jgi:hypothetical protein
MHMTVPSSGKSLMSSLSSCAVSLVTSMGVIGAVASAVALVFGAAVILAAFFVVLLLLLGPGILADKINVVEFKNDLGACNSVTLV